MRAVVWFADGEETITGARNTIAFTLGRSRFDKLSKVEGISLSREMKRDFAEFDRALLSAEERRERIKRKYAGARLVSFVQGPAMLNRTPPRPLWERALSLGARWRA